MAKGIDVVNGFGMHWQCSPRAAGNDLAGVKGKDFLSSLHIAALPKRDHTLSASQNTISGPALLMYLTI